MTDPEVKDEEYQRLLAEQQAAFDNLNLEDVPQPDIRVNAEK